MQRCNVDYNQSCEYSHISTLVSVNMKEVSIIVRRIIKDLMLSDDLLPRDINIKVDLIKHYKKSNRK